MDHAHFTKIMRSRIALPDGERVLVCLEVVDVLGVPLEADGGRELHVQLGRLLPRLARVRVVQRQALQQLPVVPAWTGKGKDRNSLSRS